MVGEISIIVSSDDLVRLAMRRYAGATLTQRQDGQYDVGGNPVDIGKLRGAIRRLDAAPRKAKEAAA